jgi:hypothetical protein
MSMQEEALILPPLANRKERRRQDALTKRRVRPTCACCRPVEPGNGRALDVADASLHDLPA